MANDEHLHKAFSFFDRNQSGYIEIEELRNALNDGDETNSEEVINAIMHDVDTDKVSISFLQDLPLTKLPEGFKHPHSNHCYLCFCAFVIRLEDHNDN